MIKPLILAAALLVPAAAIAAPAEQSFVHEGETYVYTVSTDKAGRTVLDGTSTPGATPFHYVVDGRQVDGWSGSQPVSFRIDRPLPRVAYPAATTVAAK